jgi:putative regulator of septum formation
VGQLPGRWRGEAALNRVGDSTCEGMFRRYVGVDLDSSSHGYSWFGPTKDSWAQGDRLVVCMASDGGSPMTGSVKGSKS